MNERDWLRGADPEPMLAFLKGKTTGRRLRLFVCACIRRPLIWENTTEERLRGAVHMLEQYVDAPADGQMMEAFIDAGDVAAANGAHTLQTLGARASAAAFIAHALQRAAGVEFLYDAERFDVMAEEAARFVRYAAFKYARVERLQREPCDWTEEELNATGWGAEAVRLGRERFLHEAAQRWWGLTVDRREWEWDEKWREWVWSREMDDAGLEQVRRFGHSQSELLRDIFGNPFRPRRVSPAWQTAEAVRLTQAVYDDRQLPVGTLDADRLAVLADALEDAGCDQPDLLGHLRGPGPHVRGCWAVDLLLGKS